MKSLGARVPYESYKLWKQALPSKHTMHKDGNIERAQSMTKDFEGVCGQWDSDKNRGWIYQHYLDESMKPYRMNIPTLKPRDPNQAVLASKRNAGGPMRDKKRDQEKGIVKHKGKLTFKEFLEYDHEEELTEAKSTHKDGDLVKPHDYSAKITFKGKDKTWPALKGEIYEKDVLIGTFSRGAVKDHYVPPIEYKFRSSQAKARFDDFSDSLSIEETIEALLPL
jgi:hypothetical protein